MKRKILVLAKTYPTFSKKYTELVCTAGILENGDWIRIYPIPFRSLYGTQQYHKFDWIELDVIKSTKDSRLETFRPTNLDEIKVIDNVQIGKEVPWAERRNILFQNTPVYNCFEEVLHKTQNKEISLGIFKPTKINKVIVRRLTEEEIEKVNKQLEKKQNSLSQGDLFRVKKINPMPIIPYKFSYEFCDKNHKIRKLQILDWEIFQLYNNCLKTRTEEDAAKVVQQRYEELAKTKDIFFFIGTRLVAERKSQPNPYSIIGVFYPPYENNLTLF